VLGLLALPADAQARRGAKRQDLTGQSLSVGDQSGALQAPLEGAGLLDGVPYPVDWHSFNSGPPLVEALNAGSIDVGLVGDVPPVFAAASRSSLRVIGAVRTKAAATALVVKSGSDIKSIADLKGKKVAYQPGTAGQYFALQALKKGELTLDDVESVNLNYVDARTAGSSGQVDAWVENDPLLALDQQGNGVKVLTTAEGLTSGLLLIVAPASAIKEKQAVLADFANRIQRGRKWQAAHPDEAAKVWGQTVKLPQAVLAQTFARSKGDPAPIGAKVIGDIQKIADTFAAQGIIPSKVNVKKLFVTSFNDVLGAPLDTAGTTTTTVGTSS
jgi:sulfonate transport system substrate-binding protein